MKSSFRGCFHPDEDPNYWKEAVEAFPNAVPSFDDKTTAEEFAKRHCKIGSNPYEPALNQSISTLTSWEQVENELLPRLRSYDQKWDAVLPDEETLQGNRFADSIENERYPDLPSGEAVHESLTSRLNLSIHQRTTIASTENTLRYLFFHMRCGLFVMIRNNQIVIFCPFVNKHYKNTWGDKLEIEFNSLEKYYKEKTSYCREENILKDKNEWWANGNIICNEHCKPNDKLEKTQWWGDSFLFQLKDMLAETCRTRIIPDCEFFLNKRDYPQLKFNDKLNLPVEPYGFIFDKDDRDPEQDVELSEHKYRSYAPIMSFYSSKRFADVLFPPSEDWESASGKVFPSTFSFESLEGGGVSMSSAPRDLFTEKNFQKFQRSWEDRKPTAFFRGTATGGGVTVQTNQRLHLAMLSYQWSRKKTTTDTESSEAVADTMTDTEIGTGVGFVEENTVPLLDAKITGWNLRDKKLSGEKMTFLRKGNFPFTGGQENFTPIYEQSSFKYLVYVEGHCAACRYGFMMRLGSVILKVESKCVADEIWYFPLLRPYFDHVPVAADLSDLKEQIEWCRENDEECRIIADNAKRIYERFLSKEGVVDYLQMTLFEVARRRMLSPPWARDTPVPRPPPQNQSASQSQSANKYTASSSLTRKRPVPNNSCCYVNGMPQQCARCKELISQYESEKAFEQETKLAESRNLEEKRKATREIMLKRKRMKDNNSSGGISK